MTKWVDSGNSDKRSNTYVALDSKGEDWHLEFEGLGSRSVQRLGVRDLRFGVYGFGH